MLNPIKTWESASDFNAAAQSLTALFKENFKPYHDMATPEVIAARPEIS